MPPTVKWYANALAQAFGSSAGGTSIDFVSGDIRCLLLSSAYAPDLDAHVFRSDLTGEVVGTGYVAGGVALAGKALTVEGALTKFMASGVVFTAINVTARYAAFLDATSGVDSSSPLLWLHDFGSDQLIPTDDFTIDINSSNGIAMIARVG